MRSKEKYLLLSCILETKAKANFISISEHLYDSGHLKLFQLPSLVRPWPKSNSKTQIPPYLRRIFGEVSATVVEGSIIPVEDSLQVAHFLNFGIQNTKCLCTDPSPDAGTVGRVCSTTCTTSQTLCGRTCVRSTTYGAFFSLFSGVQWQWRSEVSVSVVITSKYFQVTENDCEKLESECLASSALVEASKLAGVAVALSAGIAVGAIAIGLAATSPKENEFNKSDAIEFELKSSIERQLEVPLFLRAKRQITETVCTCQVSMPLWGQQECSATCLSSKHICGHFCIETSIFQAVVYLASSTSVVTTRTFLTIDKSDCDKMEVDCIGSSVIVAAGKAGAVFAIVTGALSAAVVAGAAAFALAPTPVEPPREHENETEEYQQAQYITTYEKLIDNSKNKIYSRKRCRSPKYITVGFFESLLTKLKSFLNVLGSRTYSKKSAANSNEKSGQKNENEATNDVEMSTVLESSIIRPIDNSLNNQNFLNFGRQNSLSLCSCADPNPNLTLESAYYGRICSTTCTTTKTLCNGQFCIGTTTFTALFTRFLGYQTSYGTKNLVSVTLTKKFEQIDNKSCAILQRECIIYSALGKARKSGVIAAGVALSTGVGIGSIALAVAMKSKNQNLNLTQKEEFYSSPNFYYGRQKEKEGKRLASNNVKFRQKRNAKHFKRTASTESNEYYKNIEKPDIESSINIQVSQSFFGVRQQGAHTCVTDSGNCSTTCLSSQMLCGGYCTLTSIFDNCIPIHFTTIEPVSTKPHSDNETSSTSTPSIDNTQYNDFYVVNEKDCERLEASCIASSALAAAGRTGEIVSGLSGVLTAGMVIIAAVVSLNNNGDNNQQSDDSQPTVNNQIPVNNLPIPVTGLDFPNDGCDDSSVRFGDGKCHPLLSRGPCNETNRWVTTDPVSLQGKCSPRLCTDNRRVFVGRTGLCHDVNDPKECQGGRRLYVTAYGDSICDCPLGKYPFPNSTQDDCVALFTQGPCPDEQVVTISQEGRLFCGPAGQCPTVNSPASFQQLVPDEKGECYALGTKGFCANHSQVLGYDIFKRQLQCVNISSLNSSNRLPGVSDSKRKSNLSNKVQLKMDYVNTLIKTRNQSQMQRRQDSGGIFRFPGSSVARKIDFLLQPCRTGARQGINHKCANPLVPDLNSSGSAGQPVSPAFTCPRNGTFLQTGGQCVNDNRATSCGPSFQLNEATGQCRPRF